MSRCPAAFRKIDVTRAVNAVKASGLDIAQVEIDKNGKIIIVTTTGTIPGDEIDRELAAFTEAQHGNRKR